MGNIEVEDNKKTITIKNCLFLFNFASLIRYISSNNP